MSLSLEESRITDIIDRVLEARERMVRQEINRARGGMEKLHESQEAYEVAYMAVVKDILDLIASAGLTQPIDP